MEIHILQAGEHLGPFSEVQVRQYLGEGVVAPSDLATCEGMKNWQPLDTLLAKLPTFAGNPEMTPTENTQTESNLPSEQAPDPGPQQTVDDTAPVVADTPPVDLPPADPIQSLTSTQKTKRKLNKIVIQPILPLEPTAPLPLRKKLKTTGKTAVTLEPLRPTTALPPVTGFAPKDKKTGKTQLRTGQLSFGEFTEKNTNRGLPPKPTVPPITPAVTTSPVEPPTLPPVADAPLEYVPDIPLLKPWYQRIPKEIIYAAAALTAVILCVILTFAYLIFAHHATPPASNVINAASGSSPPPIVEVPSQPSVPKTASDFSNRGFASQNKGDLDSAIQDYNQALGLDPKNVEALYRRGLARQAKGDADGALADYNQAIDLDPKQADAYSNRAFIKQGKGDADGALADYDRALQLNPKISRAYYNEGLIFVQKGNLDEAIDNYNHALDLDPKMAIAFYNRGVAKNLEGNLDGAIADYTQAVTLNPKIARAFCARGFARQSKGDIDGSLDDLSQAISLDPQLAEAFSSRGQIKLQRADLSGAVADEAEAIRLAPKSAASYYARGLSQYGKGNLDDAMADLKKYCELAPRDTNTDSARLYIWLITRQQNANGGADQELSTSLLNEWNSPPEDITSKIGAFLLGHISESALIANAASPNPSREPGQYCKVWFFAGMKRLLAEDAATASSYFQKSLDTNQKDLCEYLFSQLELKTVTQDSQVASKPASN